MQNSIIIYRNPMEKAMWESNVPAHFFLFLISGILWAVLIANADSYFCAKFGTKTRVHYWLFGILICAADIYLIWNWL